MSNIGLRRTNYNRKFLSVAERCEEMSGSLMISGSSSSTAVLDDKKRKEMEQWKGGKQDLDNPYETFPREQGST